MKRLTTLMVLLVAIASTASAMSFSQARSQALFLTDKMAYELNLSEDQYDAAYEINLDYLLSISTQGDLFGVYWNRRNSELQYVLSSYQWAIFIAAEYFYKPVYWNSGRFGFRIYNRYANKHKFYRAAPRVYSIYKGGNRVYNHSPYKGRSYAPEKNRNVNPQMPKAGVQPPSSPTKSKGQAVREGRNNAQNMGSRTNSTPNNNAGANVNRNNNTAPSGNQGAKSNGKFGGKRNR